MDCLLPNQQVFQCSQNASQDLPTLLFRGCEYHSLSLSTLARNCTCTKIAIYIVVDLLSSIEPAQCDSAKPID